MIFFNRKKRPTPHPLTISQLVLQLKTIEPQDLQVFLFIYLFLLFKNRVITRKIFEGTIQAQHQARQCISHLTDY